MGVTLETLEQYLHQQFPATVGHIPLKECIVAARDEVEALRNKLSMMEHGKYGMRHLTDQLLTLTAERDGLNIRLQETQASIYTPGSWICPKCNFTIVKSILYAKSGNVGADLSRHTEPCPNDGTEMRRETWQERARELGKAAEQLLDRAVKAETERDLLKEQIRVADVAYNYLLKEHNELKVEHGGN